VIDKARVDPPGQALRQGDVFPRRQKGQQRAGLRHEAEQLAADLCDAIARGVRLPQRGKVQHAIRIADMVDRARVRLTQQRQQLQEQGLAAAALAREPDEIAALDHQPVGAEGKGALAVAQGDGQVLGRQPQRHGRKRMGMAVTLSPSGAPS